MSRKMTWAIVIVLVVLVGIILYSTLTLNRYECEVCMEFHGQVACRTAAGATRPEAIRTATENACAQIASGMTDSIACGNTSPQSIRWIKQ